MLLTGLATWWHYFAAYFPIPVTRLAVLFHAMASATLVLLLISHACMAMRLNGSVRGMILGYVSRVSVRKNHSLWYKQELKNVLTGTKLKKHQKKT